MDAKPIFLLTGVVGLFFGISMLLFPEMILDMVGVTYSEGGPIMARHTGSWVLAAGLFVLIIRNEQHSDLRQSVFILFDLAFTLMLVVEIYGYFVIVASVMLLALIALHAFFTVLYTYLYMTNR